MLSAERTHYSLIRTVALFAGASLLLRRRWLAFVAVALLVLGCFNVWFLSHRLRKSFPGKRKFQSPGEFVVPMLFSAAVLVIFVVLYVKFDTLVNTK